jgi:UDP-perosamine 4-acetyltransferase
MRVIGIGAGGHAKVVLEALRAIGKWDVVGLLDADEALWGKEILGVPVLGGDAKLPRVRAEGVEHAFIGVGSVGDTAIRRRIVADLAGAGFEVIGCVHPSATVAPSARLAIGVVVVAGALINANAAVGEHAIINTGAIVEHDCTLGRFVHVSPGATLGGGVTVGDDSHIGLGAAVNQGVRIGAGTIVGSGAAVVRDTQPHTTVVGVPARPMGQGER